MKILGQKIAEALQKELKKQVKKVSKKNNPLTLATVLLGESPEQLSFVKMKKKLAKDLGIEFKFLHYKVPPSFESLANILKDLSNDPAINGILIQQPLPLQLQTDSIYTYIADEKEIEGHKSKTLFNNPLGLAVLTTIKYIFKDHKINSNLFVNLKKDAEFFRRVLKNKNIVLIGRSAISAQPIARTLSEMDINFLNVDTQTYEVEQYYKNADLIITTVGQKTLTPEVLKPGVILLNVGLRKEGTRLKGDYDEKEVDDIAGFYTTTPGGIGPIDVLYLFKNLIDAKKLQK